jgi:abortive infection bacteriophage resistance protein
LSKSIKPWVSYNDQLKILKDRGMLVDNELAALSYLERVGYYRLSGYWYPLRVYDNAVSEIHKMPVRKDVFLPESHFENVVGLYVFDKKLRLLALDALERIEMALRVDVAYLLGKKDPLAHENPACFHGNFTKKIIENGRDKGKTQYELWFDKYSSHLQRSRKEAFVQHNFAEYGALPIWVAIELWDFGLLSKLFAGMQYADQQLIAVKYGAKDGRSFAQWLRSLNYIRNISAHHSRLWNVNIVEIASTPSSWTNELNNKRPFFYFCIIQTLLKVICPNSSWGERFKNVLKMDFPRLTNKAVSLNDFGIIENWEEWSLWT